MDRSISRRSRRRIPPVMEVLEGKALLSLLAHAPDSVNRPVPEISASSEGKLADDHLVHVHTISTDGTLVSDEPVHLLAASSEGAPATEEPVHLLAASSGEAPAAVEPVHPLMASSGEAPAADEPVHVLAASSGGATAAAEPVHLLAASSGEAPAADDSVRLLAASSGQAHAADDPVHVLAAYSGEAPAADDPVRLISTSSEGTPGTDEPVRLISAASERIVLDGTVRGKVRQWQGATIGSQPGFVLSGVGQHATIGRARVDGFMMPTSVEANASATLTLKTPRGRLTLALGALPETSARPALAYRYTLQKGTGAYRAATASGTATLSLPEGLPGEGARTKAFSVLLQSDRTRG